MASPSATREIFHMTEERIGPIKQAAISSLGLTSAFFLLGLMGCEADGVSSRPDLEGGALATFWVEGEVFRLWSTNPTTIEGLFALRGGESLADIPIGCGRTDCLGCRVFVVWQRGSLWPRQRARGRTAPSA